MTTPLTTISLAAQPVLLHIHTHNKLPTRSHQTLTPKPQTSNKFKAKLGKVQDYTFMFQCPSRRGREKEVMPWLNCVCIHKISLSWE
jgi:hypothetical protein